MKFDTTLLTALTGGLAGAIATLLVQALLRWWSRPLLGFRFVSDEPGCVVDPGEWHRYLRLKIENRGRSFARNVSVCVVGIEYRDGARQRILNEEVYDLKLAFTPDRTIFDLPSKGHRFVDLVHTNSSDNVVRHYLEFVVGSSRRNELGFGVGKYKMRVVVSADNAKSVSRDIAWSWDGSLRGLLINDS